MKEPERRGFERVTYEGGDRPVFLTGDASYEVVDCAERGLRYEVRTDPEPPVGSEVKGAVRFPGGREVRVEGVVVRAGSDGVAIHFTQVWIDKEVIEGERRRLRGVPDVPATPVRKGRAR